MKPTCRNCKAPLTRTFADLGHTPLANSYLTKEQLDEPEIWYPLHAFVCEKCLLVQLVPKATPTQIFREYDYWSSQSPTWVQHAKQYADEMTEKLNLGKDSLVVEIGSNDGYLLKHFVAKGIPVLGFEPAKNIAEYATDAGIQTVNEFFDSDQAAKCHPTKADLICGTNVLAHIPKLHDVIEACFIMIKITGTVTMEFPWIKHLIDKHQFDTIYHEHFSYFSFKVIVDMFAKHGFIIHHVDHLDTHGGSIRIHAKPSVLGIKPDETVFETLKIESDAGLHDPDGYSGFRHACKRTKRRLLRMIRSDVCNGKMIAAYGAPAKGNTLLNYCGIGRDEIAFVVDDSPHKQGKFLPGSHIPIVSRDHLMSEKPDVVLLLAWNLAEPIMAANMEVPRWGGRWLNPMTI